MTTTTSNKIARIRFWDNHHDPDGPYRLVYQPAAGERVLDVCSFPGDDGRVHAYDVTRYEQRSYTHSTAARFNPRGDKPPIKEDDTVHVIKLRHQEFGDFVWIVARLEDLQHIESQLGPDPEAWTGCTLELHYRQAWIDPEPFSYTQPADPDEEPKAV